MLSAATMADISAFASVAVATVIGVAGIGKLSSRPHPRDAGVALAELLLAGGLVDSSTRQLATLASVCLFGLYVVYSFHSDQQRCRCFGQSMPSTSARAQRARNLGTLLFAVAGALAAATSAAAVPSAPVFDYLGGFMTGGLAITLPWVVEAVAPPLKRI